MANGYEGTYESIKYLLEDCDFAEAAPRVGFDPPVDGKVRVRFLNREYIIHAGGVEAADGQPSNPVDRCTLIYYITSKGGGEPAYSYVLPTYFLPSTMGGGELDLVTAQFAQKYGDNVDFLLDVFRELGAEYKGQPKKSVYVWEYTILPKAPLQIRFYPGDEEFPNEIEYMLDQNLGRYLEFEQIAFMCGCITTAATEIAERLLKK